MSDPVLFRRKLMGRIVAAFGLSALATPAACSGGYGGAAPSAGTMQGTGGSAPTTTSTTTTRAADPNAVQECFPWSADMGDCPTPPEIVLEQFKCCGCPTGWEPKSIESGPLSGASNQCCYMVVLELCAQGGRPFLIGDEARVASVTVGDAGGWHLGEPPVVEELPSADRAALASAWTEDALLEHASVASFARLSLALLAVGAPADLVASSHAAALDEVRHAGLCFALASAYAGHVVAPGSLSLGGPLAVDATLEAIAVSTIREGCVGETVAAIVAAEQLARATEPAVRAALSEIAADEARHAELAWRILAWAIRAGGSDVRRAAARTLFDAIATAACEARSVSDGGRPGSATRESHGRLDAAATREAAVRAMTEVVAPAAWVLFRRDLASEVDSCLG
jgi:hypothetical protein